MNDCKQLKKCFWLCLSGFLTASLLLGCQSLQTDVDPLYDNLGKYHYPVSTSQRAAQRYFDQGLILAFGFNHGEAARSFRQAYRIDPSCALCYWGEALVLGPNINAPMDPAAVSLAYESAQQALTLADTVTDKEKALIWALSKRYAQQAPSDRAGLDKAYAEAMGEVAEVFANDATMTALYAEALMDLHPWDFWSKQGKARPWTAEIVSMLERALHLDANHPLANHLYIHALEASPYPEKAIASAQRLPALAPGLGHLVHMPAHIYIRVGRYHDAILANQQAVKADHGYLSHHPAESLYTLAYVPHNHHFLWAAAIRTGRKTMSEQAAAETAAQVNQDLLREPGFAGTLQHFLLIPLYTKALFGEWDAILNEPAPAADLIYPTAIWHYARALALLRKGRRDQARSELERLEQSIADPAIVELTIFDLNSVKRLLQIGASILRGELAAENEDFDRAVSHLRQAVELEAELNYTEPKDWYLPPRQVLGAVLLQAGKAQQAETVYRQDLHEHPQNGWSLFGLMQSLNAQGKTEQADQVRQQFDQVWAEADVKLTASRF
ncbi:hypothetical protein Q9L42_018265 [Methylomarinum sp. Ch1-1]|uniref:Tetratricopeptide repeat protein n=1 Tax=Methylomarinum roseum TaxID=3067653 RepID=A0AAU7NUI4_9GAMM|nr:hypothetical protein [Methylomarinum sp. Ch1-1]MDP4519683.1 hypothetical protein [Methylomarinum sp. Ch1-1]